MKIEVDTKFNVGDMIHEVFWDSDIDAWNTCFWAVNHIYLKIVGSEIVGPLYCSMDDIGLSVDDTYLYPTSLRGANEAKRRNHERIKGE